VASSLKAADLLTAPSRAMLRSIEENYGPDLPPSRVVWNARTADLYRPMPKEPLVLTAGRVWDDAKNVAALARIASRLTWPVFIAGEDRHPDGSSPRFDGCRMLGRLSPRELASWYSRASIYALPARYEPFGLSVLEAALSGCALVLGDIDSLREIWGDAAVFVSSDDDALLETAISRLIKDRAHREEMAHRARHRALSFTTERLARDYRDAYSLLAASRRAECVS
jgi:glycogen(starch) synthase